MRELAKEVDANSLALFLKDCLGAEIRNGLGLMVLLPPTSPESKEIIDIAVLSADEEKDNWVQLCENANGNSNAVTNLMLGLCEVLVMQRSADSEAALDQSDRAFHNLMSFALGPANKLLKLAASVEQEAGAENEAGGVHERPFSVRADLLPCRPGMCPSELWRTSVLGHVIAIMGGLHQAHANCPVPCTLKPFELLVRPSREVLDKTYWPGLPDTEWHAWLHSAFYRYQFGQNDNVGVAECDCGYRYLLGECLGPMSAQPCGNPDGCPRKLMNGGAYHMFARGQRLVAVPRAKSFIWFGLDIGCDMAPKPGLWPLIDGELTSRLWRGNARDTTESNAATKVRGLEPIAFRALHLLVHAGALASALMERAGGGADPSLQALQKHLKVR